VARALEQTGKRIIEGHSDAFDKRISHQQNPARTRFQRHVAHRGILEAEVVGDQAVARLAPDVVAVEIGRQTVIVDGLGDARRACLFLAHREGGIEEVEEKKQRQAVQYQCRVDEKAPRREIGLARGPRARKETVRHPFLHSRVLPARIDIPGLARPGRNRPKKPATSPRTPDKARRISEGSCRQFS